MRRRARLGGEEHFYKEQIYKNRKNKGEEESLGHRNSRSAALRPFTGNTSSTIGEWLRGVLQSDRFRYAEHAVVLASVLYFLNKTRSKVQGGPVLRGKTDV